MSELNPPRRRLRWWQVAGAVAPVALAGIVSAPDSASAYLRSKTKRGAGVPISWPSRCVHWRLNEQGSADIEFNTLLEHMEISFNTWAEVACANLDFVYDGLTANTDMGYIPGYVNSNIIVFREAPGSWLDSVKPSDPNKDPTEILALTTVTFCEEAGGSTCPYAGAILDADIEFNGEYYQFSTSRRLARPTVDLLNTSVHEVGHFLGLDHSADVQSTMYEEAPLGETKKADLEQDDIDGICDAYPIPPDGPSNSCLADEPAGDFGDERVPLEQAPESCSQSGGQGGWLALLALVGLARRRRAA